MAVGRSSTPDTRIDPSRVVRPGVPVGVRLPGPGVAVGRTATPDTRIDPSRVLRPGVPAGVRLPGPGVAVSRPETPPVDVRQPRVRRPADLDVRLSGGNVTVDPLDVPDVRVRQPRVRRPADTGDVALRPPRVRVGRPDVPDVDVRQPRVRRPADMADVHLRGPRVRVEEPHIPDVSRIGGAALERLNSMLADLERPLKGDKRTIHDGAAQRWQTRMEGAIARATERLRNPRLPTGRPQVPPREPTSPVGIDYEQVPVKTHVPGPVVPRNFHGQPAITTGAGSDAVKEAARIQREAAEQMRKAAEAFEKFAQSEISTSKGKVERNLVTLQVPEVKIEALLKSNGEAIIEQVRSFFYQAEAKLADEIKRAAAEKLDELRAAGSEADGVL